MGDINIGTLAEDINDIKIHEIVAFQVPSSSNNYTWYRKYNDGWVEQGGKSSSIAWHKNGATISVALPITMANSNYLVNATMGYGSGNWHAPGCRAYPNNASAIYIGLAKPASDSIENVTAPVYWEVKGMAA